MLPSLDQTGGPVHLCCLQSSVSSHSCCLLTQHPVTEANPGAANSAEPFQSSALWAELSCLAEVCALTLPSSLALG